MSFAPPLSSSSFSRTFHRLTVGVEPLDAVRAARAASSFDVAFDVPARSQLPQLIDERRPTGIGSFDGTFDSLGRLARHESGRYSAIDLVLKPAPEPLRLRVGDDSRRFVPRRMAISFTAAPVVVSPRLFPGAAYPHPARATGIRGTVRHGALGPPARWARVEAVSGGTPVGFAHGDDRGEFLLLLETPRVVGQLNPTQSVSLRVFTRPALLVPATADERAAQATDSLWDLPVEVIADPNHVSLEGRAALPELSKITAVTVVVQLSRLSSTQITV